LGERRGWRRLPVKEIIMVRVQQTPVAGNLWEVSYEVYEGEMVLAEYLKEAGRHLIMPRSESFKPEILLNQWWG
jgi:hypothetical protein